MNEKLKVGPGMVVGYTYKLFNEADGSLLFEAKADSPDVMVYGVSHDVVPGLISAMKDLSAGDKFEVALPPQAAFGERFPDNVVKLEKEIFMRDGKLADEVTEGAMLPMLTQEGYRIEGRVIHINDKDIEMDFNHPFAGLTVRYEGEVVDVREATPEELHPVHGCGGGCCGNCGDGNCADGGCGDGGCHS